jgi:ribosomal protein S27E
LERDQCGNGEASQKVFDHASMIIGCSHSDKPSHY